MRAGSRQLATGSKRNLASDRPASPCSHGGLADFTAGIAISEESKEHKYLTGLTGYTGLETQW